MANDIKKFLLYGEKANLPADRDANVLYWCTDTRELYKGNDLYTEAVRIVESMPDTTKMAQGVLYVVASTGEAKIFDGTQTRTIVKQYTNAVTKDSTSDQVATADAVYKAITTAVGDVVNNGGVVNNIFSTKAGTVTVTKGEYIKLAETAVYDENTVYFKKVESSYVPFAEVKDQATLDTAIVEGCYVSADATDVAVKGVVVNPTYDATTRTITLPYADGTESLEINLGKDIFVDPSAKNGYNAETGNIELYLNDSTSSTVDVFTEVPVVYDTQLDPAGALYVGVIEGINTDKLTVTTDDNGAEVVTVYKMVDGQLGAANVALDAIVDADSVNYVKVADTESVVDLYTATGADTPVDVCIGDAHTASTGNADEVAAAQAGEKVYLKSTETKTTSTMIEIPASSLVDIYTGATHTDGSTTVSVSKDNVITASVNISKKDKNVISKETDGLFVDAPTRAEFEALAAKKDIHVDETAANKYNAETGKVELYLNDGGGEVSKHTEYVHARVVADASENSYYMYIPKNGKEDEYFTDYDPSGDRNYEIDVVLKEIAQWADILQRSDDTRNFNNTLYFEEIDNEGQPQYVEFAKLIYDEDGFPQIQTDQSNITKLASEIDNQGTFTIYFGVEVTTGSPATKIEVDMSEMDSKVSADFSAINDLLEDAVYSLVREDDVYNSEFIYYVWQEATEDTAAGFVVAESVVDEDSFTAAKADGLYVLSSDAIDALADKVAQNEADIAANATAIDEVSFVKCTANTVYDATVTYYELKDGEFVQHTTAVDADTFTAAVTAGTVYVKTVDAVKENEERIAAIESALTWSTFN